MRARSIRAMTVLAALALATAVAAQEPAVRIPGNVFTASEADGRQAGFNLEKVPAGPLFIHLKLKAAAPQTAAGTIDVQLNGKSIYRGQAALSSDYWRFRRYEVKAGLLRVGKNELEVRRSP